MPFNIFHSFLLLQHRKTRVTSLSRWVFHNNSTQASELPSLRWHKDHSCITEQADAVRRPEFPCRNQQRQLNKFVNIISKDIAVWIWAGFPWLEVGLSAWIVINLVAMPSCVKLHRSQLHQETVCPCGKWRQWCLLRLRSFYSYSPETQEVFWWAQIF